MTSALSAVTEHPAEPRLSATVMVLRQTGDGLEVFMVVRHQEVDFAAGALVFPGGKVAPGDADARAHARCSGIAGLAPQEAALRIAAIREVFEECGLLLARARGESSLVGADRVAELGRRYRVPLDRGELTVGEMLEEEDLELACESLVPFAHWISPTFLAKRFDTMFYLAVAPPEQLALHDGRELVESVWLRPRVAIDEASAGVRTLVPVTLLNLQKLGFSASVEDALDAARGAAVLTVLPDWTREDNTIRLRIPGEAGYRLTEFTMPIPRR